jgi:hypothetical protein
MLKLNGPRYVGDSTQLCELSGPVQIHMYRGPKCTDRWSVLAAAPEAPFLQSKMAILT